LADRISDWRAFGKIRLEADRKMAGAAGALVLVFPRAHLLTVILITESAADQDGLVISGL
jgi:hypothetical protein